MKEVLSLAIAFALFSDELMHVLIKFWCLGVEFHLLILHETKKKKKKKRKKLRNNKILLVMN